MIKKSVNIFFLITIFFCNSSFAEENLLSLKQQLDRLQREVNDLSKSVFTNSETNSEKSSVIANNNNFNFSAIDMRIRDLEKDIKNLTMSFEEFSFQMDELRDSISLIEQNFNFRIDNIDLKNKELINQKNKKMDDDSVNKIEDNSLGTIKITSTDTVNETDQNTVDDSNEEVSLVQLSPEDQFQSALDNIRNKDFDKAKSSLREFIEINTTNQLSGSAHYWLGELHIMEKNYREAALIFAEGFQKFPKSIKAPDMLFKLADSLVKINKNKEACKMLSQLENGFPKHKLGIKAVSKKSELLCENSIE